MTPLGWLGHKTLTEISKFPKSDYTDECETDLDLPIFLYTLYKARDQMVLE